MSRYLLVTFNFEGKIPPASKLEERFDKALDWVRYAPNCYMLYTTSTIDTWYERVRKVVDPNDSIFIVEFERENRAGYLPKLVWDWLNKER